MAEDAAQRLGSTVSRFRVQPPGEARAVVCDTYDETRNNLIEAKGTGARGEIRMAIGQLTDYGRFRTPTPALAVLLPARPRSDLEALLHPFRQSRISYRLSRVKSLFVVEVLEGARRAALNDRQFVASPVTGVSERRGIHPPVDVESPPCELVHGYFLEANIRAWLDGEGLVSEPCRVNGEEATLLLWAPD